MRFGWSLVLLGACGRPAASPNAIDIGGEPVARNERCMSCHADIASEWRASMHHASFDDAVFRASWAREPATFCVKCHAPEDRSLSGRPSALASLGTACTSCHFGHEKTATDSRACAGCHEFPFPGRETSPAMTDQMQRTISEHALSAESSVSCASCHMPVVSGPHGKHKSHAFGGGTDPSWIRTALDVRASREGSRVTITLAPGHVGHAVPTGDLFRRLEVSADGMDASGTIIARAAFPVGRTFSITPRGERVETEDNRPGAHGDDVTRIVLDLGDSKPARVRWTIDFQRVLGQAPDAVEIASRLRVMEGWID
jgi:hypothetical protein